MGLVREHTHVLAMTRMPEVPVLMMMRAQWKNLKISSVEVSARLRVERPKSGLPLDLGLKIIMDGRVRYHNLIEYNFIHIRIYLSRAIFFHFVFRFRFRLPIFRTDTHRISWFEGVTSYRILLLRHCRLGRSWMAGSLKT